MLTAGEGDPSLWLRNSILVGYQKGGFVIESKGAWDDYITTGVSEFNNNLVSRGRRTLFHGFRYRPSVCQECLWVLILCPAQTQKRCAQDAAVALKEKAEANGCITYASPDAIMLESPFYSTTPNFLPKAGLTGIVRGKLCWYELVLCYHYVPRSDGYDRLDSRLDQLGSAECKSIKTGNHLYLKRPGVISGRFFRILNRNKPGDE